MAKPAEEAEALSHQINQNQIMMVVTTATVAIVIIIIVVIIKRNSSNNNNNNKQLQTKKILQSAYFVEYRILAGQKTL